MFCFSLNPSAGPRVSLTHCSSSFSRNRHPHTRPYAAPPPPLPRRPSTAARAPLLLHFAAAPRASTRARAAPVPAPRCAALRCPAPPAPRAAASHVQRRRFAAPPHARSSAPLPYSSRSKGSVSLPTPLDQAHSRCSRNCLLGFFFDFFPDLQGYDLYTLLQSEIPLLHHPLHTCLHISLT